MREQIQPALEDIRSRFEDLRGFLVVVVVPSGDQLIVAHELAHILSGSVVSLADCVENLPPERSFVAGFGSEPNIRIQELNGRRNLLHHHERNIILVLNQTEAQRFIENAPDFYTVSSFNTVSYWSHEVDPQKAHAEFSAAFQSQYGTVDLYPLGFPRKRIPLKELYQPRILQELMGDGFSLPTHFKAQDLHNIVLIAEAGAGKSCELRHRVLEWLNTPPQLAIYIPAQAINPISPLSLFEQLREYLLVQGLSAGHTLNPQQPVLIAIDQLDEQGLSFRELLLHQIKGLQEQAPTWKVLLAARSGESWPEPWKVFQFSELLKEEVQAFEARIRSYFDLSDSVCFTNTALGSSAVLRMAQFPLLLLTTIANHVHLEAPHPAIVYDQLMGVFWKRWNQLRIQTNHSYIQKAQFLQLVRYIAWEYIEYNELSIHRAQSLLDDSIRAYLHHGEFSAEGVLNELTAISLLRIQGERIEFFHAQAAEYLAALELIGSERLWNIVGDGKKIGRYADVLRLVVGELGGNRGESAALDRLVQRVTEQVALVGGRFYQVLLTDNPDLILESRRGLVQAIVESFWEGKGMEDAVFTLGMQRHLHQEKSLLRESIEKQLLKRGFPARLHKPLSYPYFIGILNLLDIDWSPWAESLALEEVRLWMSSSSAPSNDEGVVVGRKLYENSLAGDGRYALQCRTNEGYQTISLSQLRPIPTERTQTVCLAHSTTKTPRALTGNHQLPAEANLVALVLQDPPASLPQ